MGNDHEIQVVIKALNLAEDNLRKAKADIGDLGYKAEDSGKRTERAGAAGRVAYWGLGEAAETAGQKVGIFGQASRMLGNVVEGLVANAGRFATGLGAVVLVVGAAITIYSHFADAQAKARDETIKGATASGKWVETALKEHSHTKELIAAKKQLAEAEFDVARAKIQAGIPALVEHTKKLVEEYNAAVTLRDRLAGHSDSAQSGLSVLIHGRKADREKAVADLKLQVGETIAQLRHLRAQEALLTPQNQKKAGEIAAEAFADPAKPKDTAASRMADDVEYVNSFRTLMQAKGLAQDEANNLELAQFDMQSQAKLMRLQNEKASQSAIEDEAANRDMARMALVAQQEEKLKQMRIAAANAAATNFVNAAKMMSEQGGAHARKYFSIYKATATAQALISTYSAAVKAFDSMASIPYVGPVLGALAAGAAIALGMAQVKAIRSQSMDGGGGGGGSISAGGGVGTYPVSPGTGLPPIAGADNKSGGGQQISITVQNGLGTQEYWDGLMENVVIPAINRAGDRNMELTIATA